VTMSVVKLLSRIVAPQDVVLDEKNRGRNVASSLHDHTYGEYPAVSQSFVLSGRPTASFLTVCDIIP